MREDFYRDYTERFKLARKVYDYLVKINEQSVASFDFFQCCAFLRRRPSFLNKKKDAKILRNDLAYQIEEALSLLTKIGAIESYDFKTELESDKESSNYRKNINYQMTACLKSFSSWEDLVKNSDYYPLEGFRQQLTNEFKRQKEEFYDINYYHEILNHSKRATYNETALEFKWNVIYEWEKAYESMKGDVLDNLSVEKGGFEIFFDLPSQSQRQNDYHQDRVIAIAGFSKLADGSRKRNTNRLAGYRKRLFSDWTDKQTDTGHYIAHSLWDLDSSSSEMDLEFNLYPQKREFNQGRSEEGKLYRQMENYCTKNKGVFLFVRPIYGDTSLRPFVIEYGILKPDLTLWIEQFVNI
jgi:hypothetical protein